MNMQRSHKATLERERLVRKCLAPENQSWRSRLVGGWNRLVIKLRRIYG